MKKWKIKLVSIFIVGILIVVNGINNSKARKEKPFPSKEEITDFLVSIGVDEKTVSTMNLSDVYLSDIPDDFWSWVNVSKEESAKIIKDTIHEVISNQTAALQKLIELFPDEEQKPILTFGPETLEELKKGPYVIAVYGKIPKFGTQEERWEWQNKLEEINHEIAEVLVEKFFRKGLVCFAIRDGHMEVLTDKKSCNNTQRLIDEIYSFIDNAARKNGVKEIPVVFSDGSDFKLELHAG